MSKSTEQLQQKQATGVNFNNLKELSQINSGNLMRMAKDIKKVIVQVDTLAKNVRDAMRARFPADSITTSATDTAPVTAVPEAMPSKPEPDIAKPEPIFTEKREFKPRDGFVPRDNRQQPQRTEFQSRNPDLRSQQQGNRPPFAGRSTGYTSTGQRQGFAGSNTRPGFASSNTRPGFAGNNSRPGFTGSNTRPGFAGPRQGGFAPGSRPPAAGGAKFDKPTERFPMTQKKVFDVTASKRKDYDKYSKDKDDRFNKRNLMRRGLAEEQSIEERIMGSRKIKVKRAKDLPVVITQIEKAIITSETITVKQLAEKIGKPVSAILKQLMIVGIVSNINSVVDFATCELVASELGVALELKLEKSYEEKLADQFSSKAGSKGENYGKRPPIVTVMGHVDHGKTSLLDYIRKSNVTSGEAGGITQHIGAYQIERKGQKITFIDTPGHAAFSAMRARGASVTDIAILVVAADDGIKPQTREAIKHIKNANVPMVVAVNKMDKREADFDRVKTQLTEEGIMPEEWGGDTVIVPISALTGNGVDKLLEMVLLVADMQELKADPEERASGMVIEAKLDKGKGPIATLIVLNGTLRVGDTIISGLAVGKARAILDDSGKSLKEAPPSAPVSVLGLDQVPSAGDQLYAADETMSKKVLQERIRKVKTDKVTTKASFSIDDFLSKSVDSEKKVLNVIVKADVQGSFEAITAILNEVSNDEVRVECIHGGVGTISESDITMAKSANATIIGFNTKPDANAAALAESFRIKILHYKIIYQAVEEVEKIIKSMRTPVFEERILGHATVIRIFKISRIGTVAGCIVNDGKITKNSKIRLFRGKDKLCDTGIITLQREKSDVKEVLAGFDMGIKLDGYNDILLDDRLEAYVVEQVERD